MNDLLRVFEKLSEFYPSNVTWQDIEMLYLRIDDEKANQSTENEPHTSKKANANSTLQMIPLVQKADKDFTILPAIREASSTIRGLRETTTTNWDSTYDSWDQVIEVSPREGYLAFIYILIGLGVYDPKCRRYRQISLAASSLYLLSLTIQGAKGFQIFEEDIITAALQGFVLIQKIEKQDPYSVETWVNLSSFCDDLQLMMRYVHFDEYKTARNSIIRKLVDLQYYNYQNGIANQYAANLHGQLFEILDEVASAQNGDPKEILLKIMNMTLFLHTYNLKPRGFTSSVKKGCDHISDWFIKIIGKFPRVVSEVLDFYIKFVITNPEKGWRTEHMQLALDYAAKYDAALFTRCNQSIIEFLTQAVYADEVSIRSRAVDLFSKIINVESHVDWQLFRHEISETPREVFVIKELIDSLRDSNNTIKLKAVQALQNALQQGSPTTKKILTEGIKFAQYIDDGINLPEEPKTLQNEIRFAKPPMPEPNYSFPGFETLIVSFLHLPEYIYLLFSNQVVYIRRAAIILMESIIKINPLIIYNTDFVKETCSMAGEPTLLVRRQTLLTVDSILSIYPNCYPVIYVWCKIFAPMLHDEEQKNIDLAVDCFRRKVLQNLKGIDQTNRPEHFMPWIIIRTLLMTQSRLYLQMNFHTALKPHMIEQSVVRIIESHILASNSTEAWVLLNFLCGKIRSKEPDSLIHSFVSYHSTHQWNNEHNLLLALEVLNTYAADFSFTALNNVFKHLLNTIKSGMIIPQVIGKAFDFLTTIDHLSKKKQERSALDDDALSENWIVELHNFLETNLLNSMEDFPNNRVTFMSHLFSYSEANLLTDLHPHYKIIVFLHQFMGKSMKIPELELELDNDRVFNSMIVISGRLSIREHLVASKTCKLYAKILRAIDRPQIVNTLLVAITDLCKKHTHIVEFILDSVLKKLSSPFLMNRLETFNSVATMILQDQIKLRGSLQMCLLATTLDENQELSTRSLAFFTEFVDNKNPAFYHRCLIECPYIMNEYPNFEGMINMDGKLPKSPLKGEENRRKRYALYNRFIDKIEDVLLIMYFGNLTTIAEKTISDPLLLSPDGEALLRDTFYILKRISQKERKEQDKQPSEDTANDEVNESIAQLYDNEQNEPPKKRGSAAKTPMRGRRRYLPTLNEALLVLEKSIASIAIIVENIGTKNDAVHKAIDEFAKALAINFSHITQHAQPADFWEKYNRSRAGSTPKSRKRRSSSNVSNLADDVSDGDVENTTPRRMLTRKQRKLSQTVEVLNNQE